MSWIIYACDWWAMRARCKRRATLFDIASKKRRLEELSLESSAPDFWSNAEVANVKMKNIRELQGIVDTVESLQRTYADTLDLIDMANDEGDASMVPEITTDIDRFERTLETLRLSTLLTQEYDACNAIMKITAGAGGTESCDWCGMLYRMYSKWADSKGYELLLLDFLEDEESGGFKSVSFQINGANVYGYMRGEQGVHRLVRISPYNAQGKRQTSFVRLEVMPDIQDDLDVEIRPEDIKMEVFRSSGAGGQHINKTSSAVRLIHLPTGVVVSCQEERSQFQNRDKAMQMLKVKLFMLKKQAAEEKRDDIRGLLMDAAWGSQIRSYVLQPYTMVKDLRTGVETSDSKGVLDGDIDRFIFGYLSGAKAKDTKDID